MKIRHYLFPALVAMMFVSCQKDDTQTPVDNGAKKSVTVTITNVAAPATRTSQDEFTPSGIPIATVGSLNVLFADENGEVVDTRLLSSGELLDDDPNPSSGPSDIIDQDGTGTTYKYTFHQIPNTAVQLAVTNLEVDNLSEATLTAELATLSLSDWQGAYTAGTGGAAGTLKAIPAWGITIEEWEELDETDDEDGFPHFYAGEVEVAPKLARIEIGNIQCLDLGTAIEINDVYPRFGTLSLTNIGIHNTKLATIGGAVFNYTVEAGEDGKEDPITGWPKWLEDAGATIPPVPETPTWNINPVVVTLESETQIYDDEVFGFNVAPGSIPNIILEMTGTENVNDDLPDGGIPGNVNPSDKYYVKSTSLNGVDAFNAGYIYQVNFQFHAENVLPWNQKKEFICVDVTVVIPDWVIVDEITPGFVDPE